MKNNTLVSIVIGSIIFGLNSDIIHSQVFMEPVKEVGIYLDDGTFVPQDEFIVGQEAIVRLTIGGEQSTATTDRDGVDMVLVMDVSGSMGWRWDGAYDYNPTHPIKLDVAKEAMEEFVNSSDPSIDQIGLVTFSDNARINEHLTNDMTELQREINLLSANGGTRMGHGLRTATDELNNNGRTGVRKYIIFPADGAQNGLPSVFNNNILRNTRDSGITVFSVAIGNDALAATRDITNSINYDYPWSCPAWLLGYDDMRFYLSLNEYLNAGTRVYDRVGTLTGQLEGGATYVTSGYSHGGVFLDGNNDSIRFSDSSILDIRNDEDVTFSIWFRTNETTHAQTLFSKGVGNGSYEMTLHRDGELEFVVTDRDGDTDRVRNDRNYNNNVWHNAVGVINYSQNRLLLYVDGHLRDTENIRNIGSLDNNRQLRLGAESSGGDYFRGTIDEFRFYNRALSSSEINTLYRHIDTSIVNTGEKYLQCIADFTGGQYYFAPTPEELLDIYGGIRRDLLSWQTGFDDYLVDQHFGDINITQITDLAGVPIYNSNVSVNNNHIDGILGVLSPDTGRIVDIQTEILPGPSGTSWTTSVDASPAENNRVTYTNPNNSNLVYEEFIDVNPVITVRYPYSATINGRVYEDLDYSCSMNGGEQGTNAASVSLQQQFPSAPTCSYDQVITPNTNGTFSFTDLDCFDIDSRGATSATYRLIVDATSSQYTERCGSVYNLNLVEGQTFIAPDLAISLIRDPWLQGHNAGFYINGSLSMNIPSTAINPYLITSSNGNSDGIAVATSISLGDGTISTSNWHVDPSTMPAPALSFNRIHDVLFDNYDVNNYTGTPPQSIHAVNDGVAVYYSSSDVTLSGDWNNINFPVAIYANGNITIPDTIASGTISLGVDGFLLIAAGRNIVISDNIGTPDNDDETPQLEGLFMAGENFNAGGTGNRENDLRINIFGTIVVGAGGANGAYLSNRTHDENYNYPSDYFIFNPKLILNTPDLLAEPIYSWQEVK